MNIDVSNLVARRSLSPVSVADNTAQVGQVVDRFVSGVRYERVNYVILTGSIADADATFTVLLEHGDAANLSDAAAVPDSDMISQVSGTAPETAAAFQFDDDNEVRKLTYKGSKRYTRLTITPVNNASAAVLAAGVVLSEPSEAPQTQPAA